MKTIVIHIAVGKAGIIEPREALQALPSQPSISCAPHLGIGAQLPITRKQLFFSRG